MRLIAIAAAVLCAAAPAVSAKGHDQGNTTVPGAEDVGAVTVASAQALGGAIGGRPADAGPAADNPAAGNAGR